MKMKRLKKRKTKKGYSLTEMLCVLVIVSMISISATTGIVAMTSTYQKVLMQSNAEELAQLLTVAISGELNFANGITVDGTGSVISFYSARYRTCKLLINDGKLMMESLVYNDDGSTATVLSPMIPAKNYCNGLKISDSGITVTYDETTKFFSVQFSIVDQGNHEYANVAFDVKTIQD